MVEVLSGPRTRRRAAAQDACAARRCGAFPGRPVRGPAEVAGCWRDEHGASRASAEYDEPV